jgi:Flagellar biosynthesis/type III secretory pathway protein
MYCNLQNNKKGIDTVKNERMAVETNDAAETKAKNVIENAKIEAEKIKQRALEEARVSVADAKEAGYNEGFKKACLEVECGNKKALNEMISVMDRLEREKDKLFAKNRKEIIELSLKIAEKVINQKLTADEKSYLKIYEKAVKDLTAQKWVKISVSKQEAEFVTKNSDYLLAMIDGAERLEIEVLDDMPSGTCIVETSDKIVDASVHTQLDRLRTAIQTA